MNANSTTFFNTAELVNTESDQKDNVANSTR